MLRGSWVQGSTEVEIKKITNELALRYCSEMGWTRIEDVFFDLKSLYESVLYPEFEIKIELQADLGEKNGEKVLGKTIPKNQVILIDRIISPPIRDPRFTFTWGHEFGHGVLHRTAPQLFRCTQLEIFEQPHIRQKEIQANQFAANLLMPDALVLLKFYQYYGKGVRLRYTGPAKYNLTANERTRSFQVYTLTDFCISVAEPLTKFFANVSKTAMGLKLLKLKRIENLTNEKFLQRRRDLKGALVNVFQQLQ